MRSVVVLQCACAVMLAGCTRTNPAFDEVAGESSGGDFVQGPVRTSWGLSHGSSDDASTGSDTGNPGAPRCADFRWGSSHDGALWVIDLVRERAGSWAKIEIGSLAIATDADGDLVWLPFREHDTDVRRFDPFDVDGTLERIPLALPDTRAFLGAEFDDAGRLWTLRVGTRLLYELELATGTLRPDRALELDLGQDGDIARVDGELQVVTAFSWLLDPNAPPRSLLLEADDAPPAVATGLTAHGPDLWMSDVDGDMHRFSRGRLQERFSVGGPVTDLAPVRGTVEECARLAALLDD